LAALNKLFEGASAIVLRDSINALQTGAELSESNGATAFFKSMQRLLSARALVRLHSLPQRNT
jgi:hypothetical protein